MELLLSESFFQMTIIRFSSSQFWYGYSLVWGIYLICSLETFFNEKSVFLIYQRFLKDFLWTSVREDLHSMGGTGVTGKVVSTHVDTFPLVSFGVTGGPFRSPSSYNVWLLHRPRSRKIGPSLPPVSIFPSHSTSPYCRFVSSSVLLLICLFIRPSFGNTSMKEFPGLHLLNKGKTLYSFP